MDDLTPVPPLARFGLWFIQNVALPLLPLLISVLVDLLIHVKTHALNGEAVLIYAIILPVVYLEGSKNPLQKYLFWGISIVGIVMYTAVQILTDLPSANGRTIGTEGIYHLAAALDLVYILTASSYEAYNTFSKNRQVG